MQVLLKIDHWECDAAAAISGLPAVDCDKRFLVDGPGPRQRIVDDRDFVMQEFEQYFP